MCLPLLPVVYKGGNYKVYLSYCLGKKNFNNKTIPMQSSKTELRIVEDVAQLITSLPSMYELLGLIHIQPGVQAHTCIPSTWKVKTRRSEVHILTT